MPVGVVEMEVLLGAGYVPGPALPRASLRSLHNSDSGPLSAHSTRLTLFSVLVGPPGRFPTPPGACPSPTDTQSPKTWNRPVLRLSPSDKHPHPPSRLNYRQLGIAGTGAQGVRYIRRRVLLRTPWPLFFSLFPALGGCLLLLLALALSPPFRSNPGAKFSVPPAEHGPGDHPC